MNSLKSWSRGWWYKTSVAIDTQVPLAFWVNVLRQNISCLKEKIKQFWDWRLNKFFAKFFCLIEQWKKNFLNKFQSLNNFVRENIFKKFFIQKNFFLLKFAPFIKRPDKDTIIQGAEEEPEPSCLIF